MEALQHPGREGQVIVYEEDRTTDEGKLEETLYAALLRVAGWSA